MEQIKDLKILIDKSDNYSFKEYLINLYFEQEDIDLGYIFQKVYLHSCLRKNIEISEWMKNECFSYLDPIQQIAIRQVFGYGKYLLLT